MQFRTILQTCLDLSQIDMKWYDWNTRQNTLKFEQIQPLASDEKLF